jgi:photosystem II stability/assembly factor-like uncharacterized protein
VSAIAVDSHNGNHVLAGTSRGFIHRTTSALTSTGATAWDFGQPREGYISSLVIDGGNQSLAYATYSDFNGRHVWKTSDGGATWSQIDGFGAGQLPDIPVHSVVVDPLVNRLYVGTDLGVFVTLDGGRTWMVENTGFANVVTEALQILTTNSNETWLYAFTHGRGAWRVRLD